MTVYLDTILTAFWTGLGVLFHFERRYCTHHVLVAEPTLARQGRDRLRLTSTRSTNRGRKTCSVSTGEAYTVRCLRKKLHGLMAILGGARAAHHLEVLPAYAGVGKLCEG